MKLRKLCASSGIVLCVSLLTAGYYYFQKPHVQADHTITTAQETQAPTVSENFGLICQDFFSLEAQNTDISWTGFIGHLEQEIGSCNLIHALREYNKADVRTEVIIDIIWKNLDTVPTELADMFEALGKTHCIQVIAETRALELLIYSFSPPKKKPRMMWVDIIDSLDHMLSHDTKYNQFRNALRTMKPKCVPTWTNPRPRIITGVILWELKNYGKLLPKELLQDVLNNKTRTTKILWSMI